MIPKAELWEKTSGAAFEAEKTSFIHFTRAKRRSSDTPLVMKGQLVAPQEQVKILGVILDSELKHKEQIAKAAEKGVKAALALRRMKGVGPKATWQLFNALVALVMDYAGPVWSTKLSGRTVRALHMARRLEA